MCRALFPADHDRGNPEQEGGIVMGNEPGSVRRRYSPYPLFGACNCVSGGARLIRTATRFAAPREISGAFTGVPLRVFRPSPPFPNGISSNSGWLPAFFSLHEPFLI